MAPLPPPVSKRGTTDASDQTAKQSSRGPINFTTSGIDSPPEYLEGDILTPRTAKWMDLAQPIFPALEKWKDPQLVYARPHDAALAIAAVVDWWNGVGLDE